MQNSSQFTAPARTPRPCGSETTLPDPQPQRSVPEILAEAQRTFEQRNALYGDNYLHFGTVMRGIFPRGVTLQTADDWNRMGVLIQVITKATRYAQSWPRGGHVDSAHDACVYAAILESLTREGK